MKRTIRMTPERLADLIAAIQVLGTYRFATRRVERWTRRLGPVPASAVSWLQLFREHPEFFTLIVDQGEASQPDNPNVSLVWRRSKERNYDTYAHATLPREAAIAMAASDPEHEAHRLSRPPLETAEISMLVDLAMELHERELKHHQEKRWWYAVATAVVGLLISLASQFT